MLLVCAAVVGCFAGARWLSARLGSPAWANPVLFASLTVAGGLAWLGVPLARFEALTTPLRWMLGPAIVALAAVADLARPQLRGRIRAALVAIVLGSLVGLGLAVGGAMALGLAPALQAAVAAKSISGPFIYAILADENGPVALAAGLSVLTGTIGAIALPPMFAWLGISSRAGRSLGMGVAAHLVGSETAMRRDPERGGLAVVALVGAGLMAAVWLPLAWRMLPGI